MARKIIALLFLMFSTRVNALYAGDFSLVRLSASDLNALAAPALPAAPSTETTTPPVPEKDWTVMVFVNGKNNLESYALTDVNQMELVGSTKKVNVLVEMGRMKGQEDDDVNEGDWTGVRRYLITKDSDLKHIASPVLDYRKDADMGSWKELVNFVKWGKTRYPARRYALILWDHGYGWKPLDDANIPDFANVSKGFSLDDATGHEISTLQLGAALKAAGGVNFFMADGCLMQMASVAYELKDHAEVMVASEEMEPGIVLRYARFLEMIDEKPQSDAEELGVNAVRIYRDYFISGGDTEFTILTQSAVRLWKMSALRAKLDVWAGLALAAEREVLASAKKACKSYDDPEYKDLYHFVSLVTAGTRDAGLQAAGADVMKFITSELVIENWALASDSNGISIYVPDKYDPLYDKLQWSRDGVWDDFARLMATLPPSVPPGE